MRITTLLEDLTLGGIEIPLRRLATSPNRLKAASWRKLLELVDYLQTSEPVREVSGFILFEDLVVSEPAPSNPARDQKLQELLDERAATNPDPDTWQKEFLRAMSRFDNPGVKVTIRADWRDYGPVRDGIPEMHYRFRVKRPGKIATEDARAKDELEAKLIICRAFGW